MYFTMLEPSAAYWISMAFAVVCGLSVPVFYMISGATLIPRDEEIEDIWKKRISRYLVILVLFSFLHYLFKIDFDFADCDWKEFFIRIYKKHIIAPYWFLYSYLGYLVILPFIRKMIRHLQEKEFIYLFLIFNIFNGVIPIVQYVLSSGEVKLNSSFSIAVVTGQILFYPAMGYYIANKDDISWKHIAGLWAGCIAAIVVACFMTQYKINLTGELEEGNVSTFFGSFRAVHAVTIFATAKKCSEFITVPKIGRKIILSVGSCTFGIYLIEQIIREEYYAVYDRMCEYIPAFPAIFLYIAMVMLIGYVIIRILKFIPVSRKLI